MRVINKSAKSAHVGASEHYFARVMFVIFAHSADTDDTACKLAVQTHHKKIMLSVSDDWNLVQPGWWVRTAWADVAE